VSRSTEGTAARRTRLPRAQRQETILRAAAEVFAEAGYRAATVSDVAERVGVTEPVIFQNFGSKAALFAIVVERAAAEVRALLDDPAGASGSASALLGHVVTGPVHTRPGDAAAGRDPAHGEAGHATAPYGVLFDEAVALAADPELTGPARMAVRAVAGHLADLIRRAQAEGGIRADADPEAAAWLLLSVLSARRLRAAVMPDDLEPAVTALAFGTLAAP
jgi:AcrR family transcriptional regulator